MQQVGNIALTILGLQIRNLDSEMTKLIQTLLRTLWQSREHNQFLRYVHFLPLCL